MKLVSYIYEEKEEVGFHLEDLIYPLTTFSDKIGNTSTLRAIIDNNKFDLLFELYARLDQLKHSNIDISSVRFRMLISPETVIGIGLNYKDHASDLDVKSPDTYPVLFFKTSNTYVGIGENVKIPKLSQRTTGEAELGIVIKKECSNIDITNWKDYVAGFVAILDMTAEDILRQNTRYLGISKIFDTFLSIGSELVTLDEIENLEQIMVKTIKNKEIIAQNIISNMTFSPEFLVTFISSILPLKPGDIISTGTPRATVIEQGDILECQIDGFMPLKNLVIDMKIQ